MKSIRRKKYSPSSEKKIPSWVPLALVGLFFLLIFVVTVYGIRGYVLFKIWEETENWDTDGVLIQQTKFSCVPCSIVMLLREKGIEATVVQVAWISCTNMKGTTPEGIIKTGEYYGFNVREEKMGFDGLMDENQPAIVEFMNQGTLHAVYVRPDRRKQYLVVKNPSLGLTHVYKNGVYQYFGSDMWDVFLFE